MFWQLRNFYFIYIYLYVIITENICFCFRIQTFRVLSFDNESHQKNVLHSLRFLLSFKWYRQWMYFYIIIITLNNCIILIIIYFFKLYSSYLLINYKLLLWNIKSLIKIKASEICVFFYFYLPFDIFYLFVFQVY